MLRARYWWLLAALLLLDNCGSEGEVSRWNRLDYSDVFCGHDSSNHTLCGLTEEDVSAIGKGKR